MWPLNPDSVAGVGMVVSEHLKIEASYLSCFRSFASTLSWFFLEMNMSRPVSVDSGC